MLVKLFDVSSGVVIPTEHCYTLKFLKDIMDAYPVDHLNVYYYLFYMTYPDPDFNPFFHMRESEKSDLILDQIGGEFSTEDDLIITGLRICKQMYETPTYRAYNGIKAMLDKIADYMGNQAIVDGRDGNGSFILRAAKDFGAIRTSYKQIYQDLKEEQESTVRGNQNLAYDEDKM